MFLLIPTNIIALFHDIIESSDFLVFVWECFDCFDVRKALRSMTTDSSWEILIFLSQFLQISTINTWRIQKHWDHDSNHNKEILRYPKQHYDIPNAHDNISQSRWHITTCRRFCCSYNQQNRQIISPTKSHLLFSNISYICHFLALKWALLNETYHGRIFDSKWSIWRHQSGYQLALFPLPVRIWMSSKTKTTRW